MTWEPEVQHPVFSQLTGMKDRVRDESGAVLVLSQSLEQRTETRTRTLWYLLRSVPVSRGRQSSPCGKIPRSWRWWREQQWHRCPYWCLRHLRTALEHTHTYTVISDDDVTYIFFSQRHLLLTPAYEQKLMKMYQLCCTDRKLKLVNFSAPWWTDYCMTTIYAEQTGPDLPPRSLTHPLMIVSLTLLPFLLTDPPPSPPDSPAVSCMKSARIFASLLISLQICRDSNPDTCHWLQCWLTVREFGLSLDQVWVQREFRLQGALTWLLTSSLTVKVMMSVKSFFSQFGLNTGTNGKGGKCYRLFSRDLVENG